MSRRRTMSPLPEVTAGPQEFSPEERTLLLKLAHLAIESALDRSEISLDSSIAAFGGTTWSLHHPLPSWRIARLRGICRSCCFALSNGD